MKKFVLKKEVNPSLIATLDVKDVLPKEEHTAFPIINAWVKDMTNGEVDIKALTVNISTSITRDNFIVIISSVGLIKVYKVEKPTFYIEEVKE